MIKIVVGVVQMRETSIASFVSERKKMSVADGSEFNTGY
jgi:hypothetical protein